MTRFPSYCCGLVALALAASSEAQIYMLVSDAGKSVFLSPADKDPEAVIVRKMREGGGGKWKIVTQSGEVGCFHRRAISFYDAPPEWIIARGDTPAEAELNGRNLARTTALGRKGRITDSWEGTFCNKTRAPLRDFNLDALSRTANSKSP